MNYKDLYSDRLLYYSPFRYLKGLNNSDLINETVIKPIITDIENNSVKIVEISESNFTHLFVIKELLWDSENLGFQCIKILNIFFEHTDINILVRALEKFKKDHIDNKKVYFFIDVPSEDLYLTQAFTHIGFRLIESRLNYYFDKVKDYLPDERYPVRYANSSEAEQLRKIAIKMRNPYDRIHADLKIDNEIADQYLGQFAFNSVNGYADYVLVPDIKDVPIFGFLAFNKPTNYKGHMSSKLVLAAIDNSIHKKWLIKLLSEVIYLTKYQQVDSVTTITQTSNIPAFRTWEQFGFKLGFVTNILVYKND